MNPRPNPTHPYPPPGALIGQSAGLGWEYHYPLQDEPSHDGPPPDDEPGRYDVARPDNVWDGEGP